MPSSVDSPLVTIDEQMDLLRRGTTEIIGEADLRRRLASGETLRIKLGMDPTAKGVTLGWAVVLRKLRDFQRLGHTACLVVGNFTSLIGDPTGKSKTRKQLTKEEVEANVAAVLPDFFRILDPARTEISYNADWLGAMTFEDVIRLCSRMTVARILERDDFAKRLAEHRPVAMHEILYPLCQGLDSVELKADVEIGGNDQKFNNLVGRTLQEGYEQAGQAVVLCPLLVGTDGMEKMSQSLGNYVALSDAPNEMFGKTMSIPDGVILNWFELCTDVPLEEVRPLLEAGRNPRDAKVRLAKEIVALYHSREAADEAERYFVETFAKGNRPVEAEGAEIPEAIGDPASLPALLVALGLAKSNSAAKDLIKAGAVDLDGARPEGLTLPLADLRGKVLRVGKHQFRRLD